MYKLVAIDLDDTLLDDDRRISPATARALEQAVNRGIAVTLATGRMFASAVKVAEQLGLNVPLITYQGSLVKNAQTGEVLYERHVPAEAVEQISGICRETGLHLQAYVDDRLYVREDNDKVRSYSENSGIPYHVEPDFGQILQKPQTKLLIVDDPVVLDGWLVRFRELFGESVQVTKSKPKFLEFTHPEGTKGHALRFLAGYFGCSMEETLAIGDSWNDRDMIEAAGLGIAMGNAVPELKALADYIAPSNREEGVRHAIERFLLDPESN